MEIVRARLCRNTDDAAFIVPELCRGVLRDDIEVADGVNVRHERSFVVLVLAIEDAVQEVLVRLFTVAIDERATIAVQILRFVNSTRVVSSRSWCQQPQLKVVAPRQR